MQIWRGGFQVAMSQQNLNGAQVRTGFQQVRGPAVAEDILIVLISLIEPRSAIAITLCTV
jgi:hypothetical protein